MYSKISCSQSHMVLDSLPSSLMISQSCYFELGITNLGGFKVSWSSGLTIPQFWGLAIVQALVPSQRKKPKLTFEVFEGRGKLSLTNTRTKHPINSISDALKVFSSNRRNELEAVLKSKDTSYPNSNVCLVRGWNPQLCPQTVQLLIGSYWLSPPPCCPYPLSFFSLYYSLRPNVQYTIENYKTRNKAGKCDTD